MKRANLICEPGGSSPVGAVTVSEGTFAEENRIGFSTKYFDEETGLVYYGYRYLNPVTGRWVNRDPIVEESMQAMAVLDLKRRTSIRSLSGHISLVPHHYRVFQEILEEKGRIEKHYLFTRGLGPAYAFIENGLLNAIDPLGLDNPRGGGQNLCACVTWPPEERIGDIREEAFAAEDRQFPGVEDPYGGAYRHCVGTCLLDRRYGDLSACLVRWVWDDVMEDADEATTPGDMAGEDAGFAVAKDYNGSCEDGCLEYYPPAGDL